MGGAFRKPRIGWNHTVETHAIIMKREPSVHYQSTSSQSSPLVQAGAGRLRLGEERGRLGTVTSRERVWRLPGKDVLTRCGGKHELRLVLAIPITRPA